MAITVYTNLHLGTAYTYTRAPVTTSVARIRQSVSTQNGFGILITPPVTGTITDISFYTSGITTPITNLDVGIMGISAFGNTHYKPDDTFISSNTVSIGTTGWTDFTLTTGVGVTANSSYYLVAKQGASFTGDAYFQITDTASTLNNHSKQSTYDLHNSSNGWQNPLASYLIGYAYKINSTWYGPPTHAAGWTQLAVNNGTDEYGFSFELVSNHPAVRVYSCWMSIGQYNRQSYQTIKAYNSSGTLLCVFDVVPCNWSDSLAGLVNSSYMINRSGTELWLEPGQKYYFMNSLTATPSFSTAIRSYVSNIDNTKKNLLSTIFTAYYATKISGTFSEDTTLMPEFGLTIDRIRY